MWRKWFRRKRTPPSGNYRTDDYKALLHYLEWLASHKLGYPVSLLTFLGAINNKALGIKSGTIANILLNNVGDPFKDSETSLLEVKKHEREVITILERYYGMRPNKLRGYVTTGGTEGNFASLWWSKRFLINSSMEKLIEKDNVVKLKEKEEQAALSALSKIALDDYVKRNICLENILQIKEDIHQLKDIIKQILTPTIFYAKNATHYSVPKVSEILHFNIRPVSDNADGAIDLVDFKRQITFHLSAHPHSPIIVIANIGTTVTGAIDDVAGMKEVLHGFDPKPLFTIHMDGALTGFLLPILKPFGEVTNYFDALGVNTLAVSAHKYPGLSQPCGIILATKDFFEKSFEKQSERSVDYVGNISDVTITGSRSGLNVLMFHNALHSLKLHENCDKLSKMVSENIDNARYLYEELVKIYGSDQVYYPYHFNIMFPKPNQVIAKKYQLMITGDRATICVLSNVSRKLINEFIGDLKNEKEKVMNVERKSGQYTICLLQSEHIDSTVALITKSFCESEPITKYLNVPTAHYTLFARAVVSKCVEEGLSQVAVDRSNNVIACSLVEDMASPFEPNLRQYPELTPLFSLLDKLLSPLVSGKQFIKGKVAHVFMVAVAPAYRGQHLATAIALSSGEMLASMGYPFACTDFTSEASERIVYEYNLYRLSNRIIYHDYATQDGQQPLAGVPGYISSYVIAIQPGVKLERFNSCYEVTQGKKEPVST
ncbi:MAG TPA: pyridoxal-dependent decarboxylase [Gammaproteobacteria bacterium]|jgi:histidine decarboxylase|nr:pyridoxal-dependent decarboxylase [Gammaproteobacteria bacterium]